MDWWKVALINWSLYAAYLEKRIGNVWYRIGEDGFKHISPTFLIKYTRSCLVNPYVWQWDNIDTNFLIFTLCNPMNYYLLT